ncbi:MAG TPA: light-harvesting protein [Myxococcales bacterium LLY-WYZ-16_1]|jgi:light-harvesting protein B-800-850 alpha chain|nr:light-harvesting protein [Myxococcales bacterium LLY-WYZ-16_1]
MNNARIWTVVSPNVGVPIFFIALVTTSLFIHFQVANYTTWFGDFFQGGAGQTQEQPQGD